jgi:gamma-glutamyltranspeptidase/glutathione hydrolase
MGKNGLVTTAHPLASLAGLDVLKEGGNAFDAVIAANAVLGVVHPGKCGIGGDVFYLLYSSEQKKVFFLNGSGRSPLEASIETVRARGYDRFPRRGVLSVTVPGCVHGWSELWKRFGSMPFERLLQPAVYYAREGFPLSHHMAGFVRENKEIIWQDGYLRQCFIPRGRPAGPGDVVCQEQLAKTLEAIGKEGAGVFYKGEIARKIHHYMERKNGLLTQKDLELHSSTWGEPLQITYGDYRIYQTPPNTQGLAVLLGFNILEGFDLTAMGCDTAELIHCLVEAKKIAYQHRDQYITDPDFVPIEYEDILDKQYASRLRTLINPNFAASVYEQEELHTNTTFFAAADRQGNAAAGIQSLYAPFGAGCTVDETGIVLQNRGSCFSLDPTHINRLEPHKRTFHTLTASIVTRDNLPVIVFGASGGNGQPQTHLQVITRLLHFGFNIQEAIEAPRWLHGSMYFGDNNDYLNMEGRFPLETVAKLESWGHKIRMMDDWASAAGQAQGIVIKQESGVFAGGADPRTDGYAAAY